MFNKATFREVASPIIGPNDGRNISRNVASLNILFHDVINLLYNDRIVLICVAPVDGILSPPLIFAILKDR